MQRNDNIDYYASRAATERALAAKASDPAVAKVHNDLAERYDRLSQNAGSHQPEIIQANRKVLG